MWAMQSAIQSAWNSFCRKSGPSTDGLPALVGWKKLGNPGVMSAEDGARTARPDVARRLSLFVADAGPVDGAEERA